MPYPWWWNGGTISTNLEVIWEMSGKISLAPAPRVEWAFETSDCSMVRSYSCLLSRQRISRHPATSLQCSDPFFTDVEHRMKPIELLGIIASFASVASLIFAAFIYHRQQVSKAKEQSNVNVLRERLHNIENNLNATVMYLQLLIRQADDQETPVRELQNMARGVRAGLVSAIADAKAMGLALSDWQYGELLRSKIVHLADEVKQKAAADKTPERDA